MAGDVAGTVDRIAVTNSSITNTASNSYTGSLAGLYSASNLKLCYADNITITLDGVTDATVGGLVGMNTAQGTITNVNVGLELTVDGVTVNEMIINKTATINILNVITCFFLSLLIFTSPYFCNQGVIPWKSHLIGRFLGFASE